MIAMEGGAGNISTKMALEDTILTPRFYTTDFAAMDRLIVLDHGRIVVAAMPPNGRLDGFPNDVPGVLVVRSSSATAAAALNVFRFVIGVAPSGEKDLTAAGECGSPG